MKKIYIIILLIGTVLTSSCKGFLDVEPTDSGDAATSIQSAADARVILTGIMSKMASGNYYGRNFPLYGDAKGGDLAVFSNGRGYDYLYNFNHTHEINSYSGIWTQGYHIIAQINNLLERIEALKAEGSTEDFDNFQGQALTARAIIYFDLVRLYGKSYDDDKSAYGVPNITSMLDASAQELRATVEENYNQIVSDLTEAESLLPTAKTNGYINYYANKATQAKVYLYMQDYDKALAAAEEIIGTTAYQLYSNDDWVTSWTRQFGTESIFELAILPSEGDLGTASLGAYLRRARHGANAILGYFMASDNFISLLAEDPDDVRHGIMSHDEISTSRMGACYKYSGSVTLQGDKNNPENSTAVNIKVIRLSEIYLIAAEAALLKPSPDLTKAADYLNEIRKRSPNLVPATAATVNLDMIANERSKELLGEGHRFFDMIRWNKTIRFNDDLSGVPSPHRPTEIDRTFYKTLLPIPIGEINANPGIGAQQNPGYGN